jgi:Flp pilus assembly protein TadG
MPHRRRARGTITIEFALLFPPLVAVLFLIIDGGRLMGTRVMLSQATIAAARASCLSSTTGPADLVTAAQETAPMLAGITVALDTCTGGCTGWPKAPGAQVTVIGQYTFTPGFFTVLAKTLSQTSRVVCE